ncbi:DUF998 domain-containing protein [Aldersonia sp. NBC_00410]|uniref:DUF998 domain-containing protein n=1 Tax=Aldersonia sp. NBC_00410 TaxID=2975954 RepID=UPI00224CA0A5|nr:DUF998 domain-containing protein [Aldersonia sp. NBC_00410]MCX5042130.1 DUF998 domain-containing protein [Aldersonia sp. NBC_00410]
MSDRPVRIAIGVLLVVAGICYSSWLLEFVVDTGLDPIHSFLSELEAPDRPYRDWFEYGDVITGSCTLIAAVAGLVCLPPRQLYSTVGWVALAVFGGATIADSQAPVGCVPAPAHPCPDEPSGLLPQLHHLHALTSTIAVTAIFVAMVSFTLTARRDRRWPTMGSLGLVLLVLIAVATVWMGLSSILDTDWALGVAQRIQVGGMSLWLITLGVAIGQSSFRPARTGPPGP